MNIKKVVFAGAPFSGKTEVLKRIIDIKMTGVHTVFMPEIASVFLRDMSPSVRGLDTSTILRQYYILSTQKAIENLLCKSFEGVDCDTLVIISDRGTADAAVYLNDKELDMIGYTPQCYDLCVYLTGSAANLSHMSTDTYRLEKNYGEIQKLQDRSRTVWEKSAKTFCTISQCETIEEKTEKAVKVINDYIGYPIVKAVFENDSIPQSHAE